MQHWRITLPHNSHPARAVAVAVAAGFGRGSENIGHPLPVSGGGPPWVGVCVLGVLGSKPVSQWEAA